MKKKMKEEEFPRTGEVWLSSDGIPGRWVLYLVLDGWCTQEYVWMVTYLVVKSNLIRLRIGEVGVGVPYMPFWRRVV